MSSSALGVGVVFAPGLEPLLAGGVGLVDVLELEPQTLWHHVPGAAQPYRLPEETTRKLEAFRLPILVHGVGGAVGGTRPPPPDFLDAFANTVSRLRPPWASEHLSFNRIAGASGDRPVGSMLPQLQTAAGVRAAAATIRTVRQRLAVPFAVETPVNYLRPFPGEMADGAYLASVASESDCGILLDLHNVWTNQRNGRQHVEAFCRDIPLDRVWEIHLGGGEPRNGYWLDAHSGPVPDEVMALARELIPQLPSLGAIVFEILPTYVPRIGLPRLARQLEDLHELWAARVDAAPPHEGASLARDRRPSNGSAGCTMSAATWETVLGRLVLGEAAPDDGDVARTLLRDPGLEVIRELAHSARAGALVDCLGLSAKLLLAHGGVALLEHLVTGYLGSHPPRLFASEEAAAFAAYLRVNATGVPYLGEVLALDEAKNLAIIEGESREVMFDHDPDAVLDCVSRGVVPPPLPMATHRVVVTP